MKLVKDTSRRNYICKICKIKVHNRPTCSILCNFDDNLENCKWTICILCSESNQLEYKMGLNSIENHMGRPVQDIFEEKNKKRRSLYLGKNFSAIKDSLAFDNNSKKIPMLKNGSSMSLQLIKIDNISYSFTLTCGFDSLTQVIACAARDYEDVEKYVRSLGSEHLFFELVAGILEKQGVTCKTYRLRGMIILQSRTGRIRTETNDFKEMSCACLISDLHSFIFQNIPSFIKTVSCSSNCTPRIEYMASHIIKLSDLFAVEVLLINIKEMLSNRPKKCTCGATTSINISYGKVYSILL